MKFNVLMMVVALGMGCNNSGGDDSDMDADAGVDMPSADQGQEDDMAADLVGDTGTDAALDTGTDMGDRLGWDVSAHPCVGNRTDALWCDDAMTCFVGCGTTTVGTGLYATQDGGATWGEVTTTPADYFASGRVNSIFRAADGLLYVGGEFNNGVRVASLDAGNQVTDVFVKGNTVGLSFTVGSFRRASNGFAIAESLTGVDLVKREQDGGDPKDSWTAGRDFWNDGDADDVPAGVQILDMELMGDDFWGVGSTINQPPTVFTPKWTAGDFDFGIVQMTQQFDGELWGIGTGGGRVVVGGVNQDTDNGIVYVLESGMDASMPANWTMYNLSTLFPDNSTWVTDVCVAGNGDIIATGRESREGWGFVLRSTDAGMTFTDMTPRDAVGESIFKDVSRCHVVASGGVVVAGANGLFARLIE